MRWATFADSFWYADALATKAKFTYAGFCRQDFIGVCVSDLVLACIVFVLARSEYTMMIPIEPKVRVETMTPFSQ